MIFKLFFQTPTLILFGLAVAGLLDLLSTRSDYRLRVDMEWRVRESWMRDFTDNENFIERARRQFYGRTGIEAAKIERQIKWLTSNNHLKYRSGCPTVFT